MSDGTEVELGGEVRGASVFAQDLREELSGRFGEPQVQIQARPSAPDPLDVRSPFLLDAWLRQEGLSPARPEKVTIVKAPEFERPVIEYVADNTPDGAVN